MVGRTCLITGATSGIGKATTIGLAKLGATIVMVARNQAKGEAVLNEIKRISGNDSVYLLNADMSSQESVRRLANEFEARFKKLHVLVNDAGVFLKAYKGGGWDRNHIRGQLSVHVSVDQPVV